MTKRYHPSVQESYHWRWILEQHDPDTGWVGVGDSAFYQGLFWRDDPHNSKRPNPTQPSPELYGLLSGVRMDIPGYLTSDGTTPLPNAPTVWPNDASLYAQKVLDFSKHKADTNANQIRTTGFYGRLLHTGPKPSWILGKVRAFHTLMGLPLILPPPTHHATLLYIKNTLLTSAHDRIHAQAAASTLSDRLRLLALHAPFPH